MRLNLSKKWMLVCLVFCTFWAGAEEEQVDPLTWRQIQNLEIEAETDRDLAFQLGYAFLQGSSGLPKNSEKGKALLTDLSERYPTDEHVAKAAYILGKLYLGAEKHEIDRAKALKYFKKAAPFAEETGLAEAPYQVASMVEDDQEYLSYMETAGNGGFLPAMLQLFIAYMEGDRVQKNDKAALAWLRKAAQSGHAEAQAELGTYFFNGQHTYQDYERAYYWTVRAAEQNHAGAQTRLGLMYKLGLGRSVDTDKAKLWFERGHQQGHLLATENLATLLLNSSEPEVQKQGGELMLDAANKGAKSAALHLVKIYEQGVGVEKDTEKAFHWQNKASSMSEEDGAQLIGTNSLSRSEKKAYKVPVEAIDAYNVGIDYAVKEDWSSAREHLLNAAMAKYPAAQLDLARVLISLARKNDDSELYKQAYAWAKIAFDGKQEGAEELVARMTEAFTTKMVESSLQQYVLLKEQIAETEKQDKPL